MAEIRSYDRPDGHKGRPCKWVGAAYVITVTREAAEKVPFSEMCYINSIRIAYSYCPYSPDAMPFLYKFWLSTNEKLTVLRGL